MSEWIPHNKPVLSEAAKYALNRTANLGWLGAGPEVEMLEAELAERFRPGGYAACVASGTAALSLAFQVLEDVQPSEEWTISTYTCPSAYHAIAANVRDWSGFLLHLSDVNSSYGLRERWGRAIVSHTFGVRDTVSKVDVEDFTHAVGLPLTGFLGALSVVSFGATKVLGAGGGGAVLGPYELVREVKRRTRYSSGIDLDRRRFNYDMSDLHAAVARARLKELDRENARRRDIAAAYDVALGVTRNSYDERVWYRYTMEVRPHLIGKVAEYMLSNGVEVITPVMQSELLHRHLGAEASKFPRAEWAASTLLSLPVWPAMSDEQVKKVCDLLKGIPK